MKSKKFNKKTSIFLILTFFFFNLAYSQQASDFYKKGIEQQNDGAYYEAFESFQQSLLLNETYGDAWFHLAQCSYYLNKFNLTLEYAENALKYAQNDADIQNLRGMAYLAMGNYTEARKLFEIVFKTYPNNVEARFGLAELDLFSGRLGDAENLYKDALKRQGSNRKALLSLALLSAEQNKTALANNYITQALRYHSGNAEVHYLASYLAAQNGDFEEAEYRIRSCIQVDNNYIGGYELLAYILFLKQNYDESIQICDFCISKNRNNGRVWYLKGLSLIKQGKKEQALDVWIMGINSNPQDEVMRTALELLVCEILPLEDSIRTTLSEYHIARATSYKKTFQDNAMRFEFQRAIKLDPFNMQIRLSYAEQLSRDGLNELYLDQLKFIKMTLESSEKQVPVNLLDTIESYDSLLQNTLSSKWNINSFELDKKRWNLGVYYIPTKQTLQYAESERIVTELFCDIFSAINTVHLSVKAKQVSDYSQAFRSARMSNLDYFIVLNMEQTSRELVLNASIYSCSSGTKVKEFSVFRTGNERYSIALQLLRSKIIECLPVRGKIIARDGKTLLIDVGKSEKIAKDCEFDIVKNGELVISDKDIALKYASNSTLGSLTVSRVGEEISEAIYTQKGFFDKLNIGDEIVLVKNPETNSSSPENERATETSKSQAKTQPTVNAFNEAKNTTLEQTQTLKKDSKKIDSKNKTSNENTTKTDDVENPLTQESLGLLRTPVLIELIRNIRNSN